MSDFYISVDICFSWSAGAQMLNYGKPVMGLPLCQTELDEGVRYLDVLDHLQKMQAVGLFFVLKVSGEMGGQFSFHVRFLKRSVW